MALSNLSIDLLAVEVRIVDRIVDLYHDTISTHYISLKCKYYIYLLEIH